MVRHLLLAILTCGCILTAGATSRAEAPRPAVPADAEIAALRAKISEQEAEIRSLREKLMGLQLRYTTVPVAPPQTTTGIGTQQPPPGWIARQFNGTTFYLVPLADHH